MIENTIFKNLPNELKNEVYKNLPIHPLAKIIKHNIEIKKYWYDYSNEKEKKYCIDCGKLIPVFCFLYCERCC